MDEPVDTQIEISENQAGSDNMAEVDADYLRDVCQDRVPSWEVSLLIDPSTDGVRVSVGGVLIVSPPLAHEKFEVGRGILYETVEL